MVEYKVYFRNSIDWDSEAEEPGVSGPDPAMVEGESLQLWGGGSLVVVDANNKDTAVFAPGVWSHAYREVDSDA